MSVPALGSDITAFIDTMKDAHSIRTAIHFIRYLRKEFISQFHIFPKIIAGADLVVGASLVGALSSVAESMDIPYRFVAFTPSVLSPAIILLLSASARDFQQPATA